MVSCSPLLSCITMLDLTQHPHRRFNLLNGSWVLVSPHRTERPWQGQVERAAAAHGAPGHDRRGAAVGGGGGGSCLLCDYRAIERESGERLVSENESFAALVPFWAVWPFETMLISKRHLTAMDEFDEAERRRLADILK